MYGITGKRDLHEEIIPNLRGYDGDGPVRIGNAAYVQRQHDVDGEMVLCLETILTDPRVVWEDPTLAPLLEHLVEEAMASFEVVDTGLWEYRTQPRHYTFSKAMCWVAAHRGAELAEFLGMPERARAMGRVGGREARRSSSIAPTTRSSASSRRPSTASIPMRRTCCCRRSA